MSSVRIFAAGAALFIAATFSPTSARACDNVFVLCQPPGYQPRTVVPRQPVIWGAQPAPTYRVAAPTQRVAEKSATRRAKKQRARHKRATKAVAAVAKPAKVVAIAKPAKAAAIAKPARAVAAIAKPAKPVAVAEPAVETPAPAVKASVPFVPASRSIAVSVPSRPIDQPAQSDTRETGKEIGAAAKLVAVVDAGEVNEIDLAARSVETFVPMIASALVEESRDRENTPSATSYLANVLAIFGGALAAGVIYLTRSA